MKNLIELKQAIELMIEAINNSKNENYKQICNNIKTEIDIQYYLNEDLTSFDELRDEIDNNGGFNIEIIYYRNAMEYLMENDNSLHRCMELAYDLGYETKNLNSELLASILASEVERENFEELESTFDEYFETLNLLNENLERLNEINEEEPEEESEILTLIKEVEEIKNTLNL